ncbi:esterase-like activity of phytase family protein [Novosphingobium rosa]|uniref:esterase-like activity of phytase family protein n=1 Tax=Novosphingobium rosa TaxID=76978 RepID=UPI00082D8B11|nr:esterase-like activity of phytase family protein [Novosphingobium rosa]
MRQRIAGALMLALGATPLQAADRHQAYALIGMAVIPPGAKADGLEVGGLSGLDYDPVSGGWFLISDDRSEHGPARLWRARIAYDHGQPPGIDGLHPLFLHREDGSLFPVPGTGGEASDAESIRVASFGTSLIWSSEGDAKDGFGPSVRRARLDGTPLGKMPLPANLGYDPQRHTGPRANLSFEGLGFSAHGRQLWLSVEAPLQQDGPLASATQGAMVRITKLAWPSGRMMRQFAYPIDPIGPFPEGKLADNGVSEILPLDARHLLVLERSGVETGKMDFRYRSRVYCAVTDGASDVARVASLRDGGFKPMRKTLAIDLSALPIPAVDNVEGMALGPVLSNGHASLVFVTDNNFAANHPTQLIALEIKAKPAIIAKTLCGT